MPSKIWPDTQISTLRELKTGTEKEKQAAMNRLFLAYHEPVKSHIREKWSKLQESDVREAADGFLEECLAGETSHFLTFDAQFRNRSGGPARLRTWLRTLLDHYMSDRHRRAGAQKRGSGQTPEPLDTTRPAPHHETAGRPGFADHASDPAAAHSFDRAWAQTILAQAYEAISPSGNSPFALRRRLTLNALRPWIVADPVEGTLADVATTLGRSQNAIRLELSRLRAAWRTAVREAVARTLRDPGDLDDELRHLVAVLSHLPPG